MPEVPCVFCVLSIEYILCNLLCEVPAALHSSSETLIKGEPKEKCQGQERGTPVCFNLCASLFSCLHPFSGKKKEKQTLGGNKRFFFFFCRLMYSNTHGKGNRIFGCTFAGFSDIFLSFLLLQSK